MSAPSGTLDCTGMGSVGSTNPHVAVLKHWSSAMGVVCHRAREWCPLLSAACILVWQARTAQGTALWFSSKESGCAGRRRGRRVPCVGRVGRVAAVEGLMAAGPCPRQSRRRGPPAVWLLLLLVACVAAGGAATSPGERLPGSFSCSSAERLHLYAVHSALSISQ